MGYRKEPIPCRSCGTPTNNIYYCTPCAARAKADKVNAHHRERRRLEKIPMTQVSDIRDLPYHMTHIPRNWIFLPVEEFAHRANLFLASAVR